MRLDRLTRFARRIFGVRAIAISLVGTESESPTPDRTSVDTGFSSPDAFSARVFATRASFTVKDARLDERFRDDPLVVAAPFYRFAVGYPLQAPGGVLIGAMCLYDTEPRVFTESEFELLRDLAFWVQSELIARRELASATKVQRGLLPRQLVDLPGFAVAGGCVTALAVGGDFYDWYPTADGAAFTIADVMGKGIGAAILAATVRAVLRAGSRHGTVVSAVDAAASVLDEDLDKAGAFVTLFHARLELETGRVRYIDAGHGLTLLVRADGTRKRLATSSLPLGAGFEAAWREHEVTLQPGDTMVSVSDGVLDLFDETLASLDEVEAITRASPDATSIVDTLLGLAGEAAPDDVTVLAIRRSAV